MDLPRVRLAALVAIAACVVPASTAFGKDYADTALNIIPSGQYGSVPPPPAADDQALLYDGLTPLFDGVTNDDLTTYFKSEALGSLGTDGPGTVEDVPRPGVRIVRDSYNVPHVTANSHDGGVWAAGWIAAEDRGLLLQQARYNARVAAIDVPNVSAIALVSQLQNFQPSEQTERVVAKQSQALRAKGKAGRGVLNDIDTYISGINAYLAENSPGTAPWTRNDVFALNALKGQFLGQGGGDEARRAQFLDGLQDRVGRKKGFSLFNDLRQFRNPGKPTTIDGGFKYGSIPRKSPGSVVIDSGSYEQVDVSSSSALQAKLAPEPMQMSNTLMITEEESATGNPLMVGGPQIGYFYPGLTFEIDMDAGNLQWRGATSAPFPGYLLIGRGEDFATTLTSASADIIDQYAERLCGGSDTRYRYKGRCRSMKTFEAGTLNGEPVTFQKTVHGSVVGYATVDGRRVAISERRSSYGKDTVDLLFNRRISNGYVKSPKTFFKAASKTPQTFNSFYIDDENVAEYTSGRLPLRARGVDPGLPTVGNGKYEWRGYLPMRKHPQGIDPKDGTMTNWNESVASKFGAADDEWGRNGTVGRVDMLDKNLARLKGADDKWSLAEVTSAMNAGATQDVRAIDTVPLMRKLLAGTQAPSARARKMLDVLIDWKQAGGSRLDVDLDGEIDDPGAAVIDGSWTEIANAFMEPQIGPQLDELSSLFSRFNQPPGGQYSGWYQYFDRDVKVLLGQKVRKPFKNEYCGLGDLERCQDDIWAAIDRAGAEISAEQGTNDPSEWRSDATDERISFAPGILPTTMRYSNRPSGIQQVISFDGHR